MREPTGAAAPGPPDATGAGEVRPPPGGGGDVRPDGTAGGEVRPPAAGAGRTRPDPRLPAYLIAGLAALIGAIATGRMELAALAAPFLSLSVLGVTAPPPARRHGEVRLHAASAVEGERVEGEVLVDWDGEFQVDVILAGGRGVAAEDPAPVTGWSLPFGPGPARLPFALRARSWGVHDLGALWIRARRPGGLTVWEEKLAAAPSLRVLPTPHRMRRLLEPAEPRAVAGVHLTRLRGHGTDFAELRPYRPGDRLRDVSWGTSARLGTPWVRVNHPERTGTVMLLLDTAFGAPDRDPEALARVARAAWAVASIHLRVQDRVGLLARGPTAAWLPPRGGGRARWMLLDELLGVGRAAADPVRRGRLRQRVFVPADALIVGVTNLRSQAFPLELLHFRRTGHATVALVIDTLDLLREAEDPLERAARRIWITQRETERRLLERGGVPTAVVPPRGGVEPAIATLRRRMAPARGRVVGVATP